jgi:hypothetical protein
MQPVVTSGHVVSQCGVPVLSVSESRWNRDDVSLVVDRAAVETLDLQVRRAGRILGLSRFTIVTKYVPLLAFLHR